MTSKIFLIRLRLKNCSFAVTRPTQLWRCQLKIFYWTSKSKFFFEFPKHFLRQLNIKFLPFKSIFTFCWTVSGQLPPEENCSPVRVGVSVKVRVSFRAGGNQTIVPEKNCLEKLGLGFGLVLGLWVEGNFPRGQFMNIFFWIVLIFPCCFSFKIFLFEYELFLISLGK